ncbi:transcriptional regulator [Anopheles sinensis]|uniref:Transcriptional regulator n=1 Tax=Anopheles sinensis TaxID=74873 RepID=A0A084VQ62_ANOSI|nr:transcriptional regulator [Anopheles sinensis]
MVSITRSISVGRTVAAHLASPVGNNHRQGFARVCSAPFFVIMCACEDAGVVISDASHPVAFRTRFLEKTTEIAETDRVVRGLGKGR